MDRRTEISRSFFDYLNKKAFPYLVLRNADQITTHLGHDIDMCIDKKRVGLFEEVLREFCLLMKLDAYSTQQISYFNVYVIYDKENQFFIRIDTFTAFDYRGVPILDFDELYRSAKPLEGILHCSYEYQYFIILLKEILNNGLINEKTNHRLQLLNERIELNSLTELFKKHAGTSLSSVLLSRDLRQTEFSLVSLKNKIMLYIFAKRPLKTIFGRVRWIWKHIVLLLHPKGFKLVVLSEKKEMFQRTYILLKQMFEYQLFNSLVLVEPNREQLPSSRSFKRIQSRISSVFDKARTRMIIESFNARKACNFEEGKLSCSGISSADAILLLVNELGSFGVNLHEKPILYLSTHASERESSLTICRLTEIMLMKFRKL